MKQLFFFLVPASAAEAPPAAVTVVASSGSFQKPAATLSLGQTEVADPKGMHVLGQSKPLSFASPVSSTMGTVLALGGSTSTPAAPLTFGGGLATGQSVFGFKPLGGATSLGSGITSQKGQLAQPIFGSNTQFNQSNNDASSSQPSDTSLSGLLGSASQTPVKQSVPPGGATSATRSSLGFGGQLAGSSGQLAGVMSTDLTGSSQSSRVPQLAVDGQTSGQSKVFLTTMSSL